MIQHCQVLVTQSYLTLWDPRASLSMEFPRQEYWSGLPFPPPGDLPNPRIKPRSPALQFSSLSHQGSPTTLSIIGKKKKKKKCPLRFRLCALIRGHISESTLCIYSPSVSNGIKNEWKDKIRPHSLLFFWRKDYATLVCESHCLVRLFVTPWTIQSMKFSRPEY